MFRSSAQTLLLVVAAVLPAALVAEDNLPAVAVADVVSPAPALELRLVPPSAQPEPMDAQHGDFPYLAPLPGSTLLGGSRADGPIHVRIDGAEEGQIVGGGALTRRYALSGLSSVAFVTVYAGALQAAGWTIASRSAGADPGGTSAAPIAGTPELVAHYARDGRNLWAHLRAGDGGEYQISVADAGAQDFATRLARDCRVPLYGVLFDFNQATLRPESDAVLQQALAALQANPALKVDVQGHTDNARSEDYNLRLSGARAGAVVQWLVAHGIEAARLNAAGYGSGAPVASNEMPEGRAHNRRIELACRRGVGATEGRP